MFPGQGAQHVQMAAGLYGHYQPFTEMMDRAFSFFERHGRFLRREWLASTPSAQFDDVSVAQPLLYAVNCALGTQAIELGIRPDVLMGHSVGELSAATFGGVFDFETGLQIIDELIDRCSGVPAGGMISVACSADRIESHLTEQVTIGAINAPRQLLLAGPDAALEAVRERLIREDITCKRTPARQPFHSPAMLSAPVGERAWATKLREPARTVLSCYTGKELDKATATDPDFWSSQPALPVLFGPTLDALLAERSCLLIQTGPGQNLTALARRLPTVRSGTSAAVPMLPAGVQPDSAADREAITALLRHPALVSQPDVGTPR
ncbi:acyltransferase domain-containing protein [Amycolatopsis keratiniphila]|nr:acyltransferase domain-containing protein [Amycolatopsis keratiniphila]